MDKQMTKISHNELVELLQDGRIDFLQYVANGEHGIEYINWCKEHNIDPSNDTAELFCQQVEIDMFEHKYIDDENDGIWH